jgi:hypothetical protein
MMPMQRRAVSWVATLAFASLVSTSAVAGAKDAAALKASEKAMNDLFAAANFDEARASLEGTLSGCAGCSKHTLAQLHLNLGVVWVTGFRDQKKGGAEMAKARSLDPGIALDPMVTTPEVQAVFGSAKAAGPIEQDVVLDDEDGDEDAPKKKKKKHVEVDEEEAREPSCTSSADCDGGNVCQAGECVAPPPPPKAPVAWLGIGLVQDFAFLSGKDVCSRTSQVSGGYTCLRASGSQYHGTPVVGLAGKLSGASLATTRVTLSSYFPIGSFSGGLRVGYAFLGQGPQPDGGKKFLAFHGELQGAYWFTGHAFSTKSVGFFVELAGGVAEIDGKGKATITENQSVPPPSSQLNNPPVQQLDIYQKSGSGFIGGGPGVFLPFGAAAGLLADLRLSGLFPNSGLSLSLGLSGVFGL